MVVPGEKEKKSEEKDGDLETDEAKKIVEALTANDNQTCKFVGFMFGGCIFHQLLDIGYNQCLPRSCIFSLMSIFYSNLTS